jgi:hypothetical protein
MRDKDAKKRSTRISPQAGEAKTARTEFGEAELKDVSGGKGASGGTGASGSRPKMGWDIAANKKL